MITSFMRGSKIDIDNLRFNLPIKEDVTTKASSSKGVYVVASSAGFSGNNEM
jgi:hypothetical protein